MNKPERKRFNKLISYFPISVFLLSVMATATVLNPSFFDDRFSYLIYESINCSYACTIFMLMVAYVRRLCAYNYIAIGGLLLTNVFNTVVLFLDLPQSLYEHYYMLYTVSVMIPVAMLAMLAVALNTPIQKLIDEYMNPKPKDT